MDEDLVVRDLGAKLPQVPKCPPKLGMTQDDVNQMVQDIWRQNHPGFLPPHSPAALRSDILDLLEFKSGIGECPSWYEERAAYLRGLEPRPPKIEKEKEVADPDLYMELDSVYG